MPLRKIVKPSGVASTWVAPKTAPLLVTMMKGPFSSEWSDSSGAGLSLECIPQGEAGSLETGSTFQSPMPAVAIAASRGALAVRSRFSEPPPLRGLLPPADVCPKPLTPPVSRRLFGINSRLSPRLPCVAADLNLDPLVIVPTSKPARPVPIFHATRPAPPLCCASRPYGRHLVCRRRPRADPNPRPIALRRRRLRPQC